MHVSNNNSQRPTVHLSSTDVNPGTCMLRVLAVAPMLSQQPAVPNETMLAVRKYLPTHCGRKRVALT